MRARIPALFVTLIAAFAAAQLGLAPAARACTTFSAPTPEGRLLGKGFDWSTGRGWMVLGERGRTRALLVHGGAPRFAPPARYASLSLTTVGPGFPISGMNEAGLAIEALVDLDARATLDATPGRLTSLQVIQLGLDHFATVDQLTSFVRRAGFAQIAVPLHFFACDRRGECAVIEQARDEVRVTRALPVAALANRPYADDLDDSRPRTGILARLGLRPPNAAPSSSQARFRAVADALRGAPIQDEKAALALLERVAIPGATQWQIVWNLDRGAAVVRQRGTGLGVFTARLADLDLRCRGRGWVRPLGRLPATGFVAWSAQEDALVEGAVLEQLRRATPEGRKLAAAAAAAASTSACGPTP